MKTNKKKVIKEQDLEQSDLIDQSFERNELNRVYAVDLTFNKISFKQAIINKCYFRNCIFKNCDFTGCQVTTTNMQGSDFIGCTFNYATFRETYIGIDPLSHNLPGWENLKLSLAKGLRMNYASIGDWDGVNFAIRVELNATKEHLRKAAFSRESYYRKKKEYNGIGRVIYICKFLYFFLMELLWGNGEKPLRMFVSVPVILVVFTCIVSVVIEKSFIEILKETILFFLIGGESSILGNIMLAMLSVFRYMVIGLFVSSLVRRLSRR